MVETIKIVEENLEEYQISPTDVVYDRDICDDQGDNQIIGDKVVSEVIKQELKAGSPINVNEDTWGELNEAVWGDESHNDSSIIEKK